MKKLPPSNLPELAVPWGRELEREVVNNENSISSLQAQLADANQTISSQATQLTALQNYIRTICELSGIAYPPTAAPPAPPVPVEPAFELATEEFAATWSATWYQSFKRTSPGGTNDDSQSLYQRGSGYTYSMWRFDIGAVRGKEITAASMYLSNISTYYNGPFTAFLGTHALVTEPASRQGRTNAFDVGWQAGEGKWIALPATFFAAISNGSIQGFTMGDTTPDRQNFARFNGVGRPGAPRLRLQYKV